MKKIVLLDCLLIISFLLSILCIIFTINLCINEWKNYFFIKENFSIEEFPSLEEDLKNYLSISLKLTIVDIFSLIILISNAVIFFIINPQIFKKSNISKVKIYIIDQYKKRKAEKEQRQEEAKQKRIEELQKELNELKKDE